MLYLKGRWVKTLLLLIMPSLSSAFFLAKFLELPPLYATYFDPSYPYILNGAALFTESKIGLFQHPGISLQWLIGFVNLLIYLVKGTNYSYLEFVIQNIELLGGVLSIVLLIAFYMSFIFFSLRLSKYVGILSTIATQFIFFSACTLFFPWILLPTPETLVLICALICMGILFPVFFGQDSILSNKNLYSLGIFLAVGLMAKVIFLPLVLFSVFLVGFKSGWRTWVAFFSSILVFLGPVFYVIDDMYRWFSLILTSPSRYGDQTDAQWSVFSNLKTVTLLIIQNFKGLSFVLLFVTLNATIFLRTATSDLRQKNGKLFLIIASLGVATVLIGYKQFTIRDFILLSAFVPMLFVFALQSTLSILSTRLQKVIKPLAVIFAFFVMFLNLLNFNSYSQILTNETREKLIGFNQLFEVDKSLFSPTKPVATSYGVISKQSALMFGNDWANLGFSKEIVERYPNSISYDLWQESFFLLKSDKQKTLINCSGLVEMVAEEGLSLVLSRDFLSSVNLEGAKLFLRDETMLDYEEVLSNRFGVKVTFTRVTCPDSL